MLNRNPSNFMGHSMNIEDIVLLIIDVMKRYVKT